MRSFRALAVGGFVVASALMVAGCGTAEAPTEPEVVVTPAPTITATPGSEAPAVDAPSTQESAPAPVPAAEAPATIVAASTGDTVYPGSWLGMCTKLSDCNCSDWAEPQTCSTELSAGYEMGLEQAVAMGLPEEMLAQARMTPDKLSEIANESCPRICEAAAQFRAAMRRQATP